jgi:hypothetical protein
MSEHFGLNATSAFSGHEYTQPLGPEPLACVRARLSTSVQLLSGIDVASEEALRRDSLGNPNAMLNAYELVSTRLDGAESPVFKAILPGGIASAWMEDEVLFTRYQAREQNPGSRTFIYTLSENAVGWDVLKKESRFAPEIPIKTLAYFSLLSLTTAGKLMDISTNCRFNS